MERREFLVLPATIAAGRVAFAQSPAPWHQRVRRIGQVNANERDPVELDVKAWADYWASLKVNAVLISVTGIVAFYPTQVPNFRRAAFLGGRDFFGDCCRAAKERGLRVIARFSPDLQWEEFLNTHPEWFSRNQAGQPFPQTDAPGLYRTCHQSSYFGEQIPAIMREINARYDVDGLYTNGWPSLGRPSACYCERCRKLPEPGTAEYDEAYVERVVELWKLYTSIAREKRPENIYFANLGGGIRPYHNLRRLAEVCEWFNCDYQGRGAGDNAPAWGCAQQGRVAQSVMKGRTITLATGTWSTSSPRYRNVAKSPAEITLWLAETVASGMVPWYHWLGGQTGRGEDRRWQEPGREFFQWLARHERHFYNRRSVADLGVIFSQRTHAYHRPPAGSAGRADTTDALQGLYYTLLEGRFCFDFVHEDDLGPETVRKYRALLLPNVALLSDRQCRQLEAYVAAGGSLLATFETSLFDERGGRRPGFGLGSLFGIQLAGERQGPNGNAPFARIERQHEILRGFQNTNWIAGGEFWMPVKAETPAVLTVVPAYTAYPPERVYAPTPRSEFPALVLAEKGPSRLLYLPGSVDATAWQTGHTDLSLLLENCIRWVTGGRAPVTVSGEGVVELFAWETEAGYALHILNYNNPALHRGWFRRHYPIGPQKVRFEVPGGARIARVDLLRSERTVRFDRRGNAIEFEIPGVTDYEVAALVAG